MTHRLIGMKREQEPRAEEDAQRGFRLGILACSACSRFCFGSLPLSLLDQMRRLMVQRDSCRVRLLPSGLPEPRPLLAIATTAAAAASTLAALARPIQCISQCVVKIDLEVPRLAIRRLELVDRELGERALGPVLCREGLDRLALLGEPCVEPLSSPLELCVVDRPRIANEGVRSVCVGEEPCRLS